MKLTTEEYRRRAIRIKCNKCGQWMAHHATAATPRVRAEAPHADLCRECAEAERLRAAEHPCGRGCQCDPPGSGEEYCTGNCYQREEIAALRARLRGEEGCPACHEDHPEGTTCPPHEARTTGQASVNALMRRLRARAARAEDRLAALEPLARACAEAVEKHDSARIAHEAAIAAASFDGILFPFLLVKEEAAAEKREAVVAYKAALAADVRIRELLALPEGEPNV